MTRTFAIALAAFATDIACCTAADCAPLGTGFRSLEQSATCMLDVLKSTLGIDAATLGHSSAGGWYHPYVTYKTLDQDGNTVSLFFEAERPAASKPADYSFLAVLPGLSPTPTSPSSGAQTEFVVKRWTQECHVSASVHVA